MGRRRSVIDATEKVLRFDLALEVFANATCSIVLGDTLADAWAYARAEWPSIDASYDPGDDACVIEIDGRCVMLVSRPLQVDVLAHEAVHVAAWILSSRGMPFDDGRSQESVAYLVQWVVRNAWARAQCVTPCD
ncbi:MAG: hypothetical protein E6Q97_36910 [Desulfurellales bacterium]|nr:MAG: hypothetical protein E6Q97_36910 [Desulfurellales bacterium]